VLGSKHDQSVAEYIGRFSGMSDQWLHILHITDRINGYFTHGCQVGSGGMPNVFVNRSFIPDLQLLGGADNGGTRVWWDTGKANI